MPCKNKNAFASYTHKAYVCSSPFAWLAVDHDEKADVVEHEHWNSCVRPNQISTVNSCWSKYLIHNSFYYYLIPMYSRIIGLLPKTERTHQSLTDNGCSSQFSILDPFYYYLIPMYSSIIGLPC